MSEAALRTVAALAALVVALAPVAPVVVAYAKAAWPKVRDAAKGWPHLALACVLAYVAMFGIPRLPAVNPAPTIPQVVVPVPSEAMQKAVADVHRVLAGANPVDRAVWAQLWQKAGIVVSGDATDAAPVFAETRALRLFNILSLKIGWRRLGDNAQGKYPGLGEATERAFAAILGSDVQDVTPDLRAKYVELCNALAWCGAGRG